MDKKDQNRIEYMVSKFQELVAKHDFLTFKFAEMMNSFENLSQMFISHKKELESVKKSQESLKVHLDSNKLEQSNLWNISGNISDKLSKRIDAVHLDVKNESLKHERHDKSIHDLKHEVEAKVAKNNHLETYSLVKTNHDRLLGKVDDLIGKVDPLLSKIASHADDMKSLSSEQEKQVNEFIGIKSLFVELEKQCKSALQDQKQRFDRDLLTISSEMIKKMDSFPKPEKFDLSSIKQDVSKQVEPAFLDAKNANLRSSNNEVKINILEKKLEQLQLMMNKLQLQE